MPSVEELHAALGSAREAALAAEADLAAAYSGAIAATARRAARLFSRLSTKNLTADVGSWEPPPLGEIIDVTAAASLTARRTAKPRRRMLTAVGDAILELADEAWDPRSELADALLANLGDRAEDVAEGLREPVAKIIGQAYEEGWSVSRSAAAIVEVGLDVKDWQAATLARTDLVSIENGGSWLAVRQVNAKSRVSGEQEFTHKRWLSASDGRVRPDHATAHGQTVPLEEAFSVGGAAMQYPGDPAGPPAEVFNCRCTLTYLAGSDALAAAGLPPLPEVTLGGPMTTAAEAATTLTEIARLALLSKEQIDEAARAALSLSAATTIIVGDEAEQLEAAPMRWESDLAFENLATQDGRYMLPDCLSWRDPPLTLMAMVETTEGGHLGAQVAGRMDSFSKRAAPDIGEDVVAVRSSGIFDDEEYGAMIARMVEDEMLTGISVDLAIEDWAFRDPETGEILEPDEMTDDQWEQAFFGELQFAVREAVILAATVCPTPAFAEAKISLTASGERRMTLFAPLRLLAGDALTAAVAPLAPPRAWFEVPEPDELTPMTITEEGQVYGHAATYDCHRGFQGHCVTVPGTGTRSGFADFHLGQMETEEGDLINVGKITVGSGHALDTLSKRAAQEHYDNVDCVAAFVRAYAGAHGTWVCGALKSDITPERLRDFRANPPSGDWRGGELVAFHSVVIPGLPVQRTEARVALAADGSLEVLTLITPPVTDCEECAMGEEEYEARIAALSELADV